MPAGGSVADNSPTGNVSSTAMQCGFGSIKSEDPSEGAAHGYAVCNPHRRPGAGDRSDSPGPGLPDAPGHDPGADGTRWQHGDGRAPAYAEARAALRPTIRHREPAGS